MAKKKGIPVVFEKVGEVVRIDRFPINRVVDLTNHISSRAEKVGGWRILEEILPAETDKKNKGITTVHVMGPLGEVESVVRGVLNLKK